MPACSRGFPDDADLRRVVLLAARLCGRVGDAETHERAADDSSFTGYAGGESALTGRAVGSSGTQRDDLEAVGDARRIAGEPKRWTA